MQRTVYCVQCTVCNVQCAPCGRHLVEAITLVRGLRALAVLDSAVCSVHCVLPYNVQGVVYRVYCAVCSVYCVVCSVLFTVQCVVCSVWFSVQCVVCSVYCVVFSV